MSLTQFLDAIHRFILCKLNKNILALEIKIQNLNCLKATKTTPKIRKSKNSFKKIERKTFFPNYSVQKKKNTKI